MEANRKLEIQEPIWNEKAVGIAIDQHDKLEHVIQIDIMYVSKRDRKRVYPKSYHMTVQQIIDAKKRLEKRGGNHIFVVPISQLIYAPEENP